MLPELMLFLTTPCPRWARRHGYLAQAIRLWARYRRCATAWAPHLAQSRDLIQTAASFCPIGGRAVVLGSGLLGEIPVDDLAQRFSELVLVDAVHLAPARRAARRYAAVRLISADVTGTFAPRPLAGERFDLAVSANLLSQLPLLPEEARDRRGLPPDPNLAATLIRDHLSWLADLAGVTCLITDTESSLYDRDRQIETEDQLYGITLPPPDRSWHWDLAPHPEDHPRFDRRNRVAGYRRFLLNIDGFSGAGVDQTG